MKNLAILFTVLFVSFSATAQDKEGVTLTVIIENVLNEQGTILTSLHSKDTFMKSEALATLNVGAKKGEMNFTFENVTPGSYAVMILHDSNDNKRMDYQPNGMPKENYGMSNNPMLMGPPSFSDAKFEVDTTDTEIRIRF